MKGHGVVSALFLCISCKYTYKSTGEWLSMSSVMLSWGVLVVPRKGDRLKHSAIFTLQELQAISI